MLKKAVCLLLIFAMTLSFPAAMVAEPECELEHEPERGYIVPEHESEQSLQIFESWYEDFYFIPTAVTGEYCPDCSSPLELYGAAPLRWTFCCGVVTVIGADMHWDHATQSPFQQHSGLITHIIFPAPITAGASLRNLFRDLRGPGPGPIQVSGLYHIDTAAVTDMSFMFANTDFVDINLSNWDVGRVISVREMFAGAWATAINLGGWDMTVVEDMTRFLAGTNNLSQITLGPQFAFIADSGECLPLPPGYVWQSGGQVLDSAGLIELYRTPRGGAPITWQWLYRGPVSGFAVHSQPTLMVYNPGQPLDLRGLSVILMWDDQFPNIVVAYEDFQAPFLTVSPVGGTPVESVKQVVISLHQPTLGTDVYIEARTEHLTVVGLGNCPRPGCGGRLVTAGVGSAFIPPWSICYVCQFLTISAAEGSALNTFTDFGAPWTHFGSQVRAISITGEVRTGISLRSTFRNMPYLERIYGFENLRNTADVGSMDDLFYGANNLRQITFSDCFRAAGAGALGLPDPRNDHEFTGFWQSVGGGTVEHPRGRAVLGSEALMDLYRQPNNTPGDTWVWQRRDSVVSIAVVDNPDNLVYDHRETLDLTGLVIRVTYTGGGTRDVAFEDADRFAAAGFTAAPAHDDELLVNHDGAPIVITHEASGHSAPAGPIEINAAQSEHCDCTDCYIIYAGSAAETLPAWDLCCCGTLVIPGGAGAALNNPVARSPWADHAGHITSIVITGPITAGINIRNTFAGLPNARSITGLHHLNTLATNNMTEMFRGSGFETLDLSGFDTRPGTVMTNMLADTPRLTQLTLSTTFTAHTGGGGLGLADPGEGRVWRNVDADGGGTTDYPAGDNFPATSAALMDLYRSPHSGFDDTWVHYTPSITEIVVVRHPRLSYNSADADLDLNALIVFLRFTTREVADAAFADFAAHGLTAHVQNRPGGIHGTPLTRDDHGQRVLISGPPGVTALTNPISFIYTTGEVVDVTTFEELQYYATMPGVRVLRIMNDIDWGVYDGQIIIPHGADITLISGDPGRVALNRGSFDNQEDGRHFVVEGTLTLGIQMPPIAGTFTGLYPNNIYLIRGLVTAGSADEYGGGSVQVRGGGVFNMYGGSISGNTNMGAPGGGVAVLAGGVFNMYGGIIQGNQSGYNGGGVAVGCGGVFNMSGVVVQEHGMNVLSGVIRNNTARRGGGVRLIGGGALNFSGGAIIYNTALVIGGGIDLDTEDYLNLSIVPTPAALIRDNTVRGEDVLVTPPDLIPNHPNINESLDLIDNINITNNIRLYNVTFDFDGGLFNGQPTGTQRVHRGAPALPPPVGAITPPPGDWVFDYWHSSEAGVTIYSITRDVTFTARWRESDAPFYITFDFGFGAPVTVPVQPGGSLPLQDVPQVPDNPGFNFDGWYPTLNLQNVMQNRTFTAQWSREDAGQTIFFNQATGRFYLTTFAAPPGTIPADRVFDPRNVWPPPGVTWSWDANENILNIHNMGRLSTSPQVLYIFNQSPMAVNITGNVNLTASENIRDEAFVAALFAWSGLTITGGGTLNATGGWAEHPDPAVRARSIGIYIHDGPLTISMQEGGRVNARGTEGADVSVGIALSGHHPIAIHGGEVNAVGRAAALESYGISSVGDLILHGGTLNMSAAAADAHSYGFVTRGQITGLTVHGGTLIASGYDRAIHLPTSVAIHGERSWRRSPNPDGSGSFEGVGDPVSSTEIKWMRIDTGPMLLIFDARIVIDTPIEGRAPAADVRSASPDYFTASPISWDPDEPYFVYRRQYTAALTLTANPGRSFAANFTASVNGMPAYVSNFGTHVEIVFPFGPTPGAAGCTGVRAYYNGSANMPAWDLCDCGTLTVRGGNFTRSPASSPWFNYREHITRIEFTAPITAGGAFRSIFRDLHRVSEIVGLDFIDTGRTTDMTSMFNGASSLVSIDISSWDTGRVTGMAGLFLGTAALRELRLGANFRAAGTGNLGLANPTGDYSWRGLVSGRTPATSAALLNLYRGAGVSVADTWVWFAPYIPEIVGVNLAGDPARLDYMAGQALNLAGLVVELVFSDNSVISVPFANFAARGLTACPAAGELLTTDDHDGAYVVITHDPTGYTAQTTRPLTVRRYFDVTFNLAGGTYNGEGQVVRHAPYRGGAVPPNPDYITPPEGRVFNGWQGAYINVTSDLTVTALWVYAPCCPGLPVIASGGGTAAMPSWTLCECGTLTVRGGTITHAATANSPWIARNEDIRRIVFTAPVTATGALRALFRNLNRVTEIVGLNHINTAAVTDMTSMFNGASALVSIDISGWDTGRVSGMAGFFTGTASLREISLGENFRMAGSGALGLINPPSADYMARWQNLGQSGTREQPRGDYVLTAAALVDLYRRPGGGPADTWVWQPRGMVTAISVERPPARLVFAEGQELNLAGLQIRRVLTGMPDDVVCFNDDYARFAELFEIYPPQGTPLSRAHDGVYINVVHRASRRAVNVGQLEILDMVCPVCPAHCGDIRGGATQTGDFPAWAVFYCGVLGIGGGPMSWAGAQSPWHDYAGYIRRVVSMGEVIGGGSLNALFRDLALLEQIDLSAWDTTGVSSMDEMFGGTHALHSITFGPNFRAAGSCAFGLPNPPTDGGHMGYWRRAWPGTPAHPRGEYVDSLGLMNFYREGVNPVGVPNRVDTWVWRHGDAVVDIAVYTQPALVYSEGQYINLNALLVRLIRDNEQGRDPLLVGRNNADIAVTPDLGRPLRMDDTGLVLTVTHLPSGLTVQTAAIEVTERDCCINFRERAAAAATPNVPAWRLCYCGTLTVYGGRLNWTNTLQGPWSGNSAYITRIRFMDAITAGDSLVALFRGLNLVEEIVGLENINTQDTRNMYRMFSEMSSLQHLDISVLNTFRVFNMTNMFAGVGRLQSLTIGGPNFFAASPGAMGLPTPPLVAGQYERGWQNVGPGTIEHPRGDYLNQSSGQVFDRHRGANFPGTRETWVRMSAGSYVSMRIAGHPNTSFNLGQTLDLHGLGFVLTTRAAGDTAVIPFNPADFSSYPAPGTALSMAHHGQPVTITHKASGLTVQTAPLNIAAYVFTVTFDAGGGELVSGDLVQEVPAGGTASPPTLQRDGYIFIGWDGSFDSINEPKTLTAQWVSSNLTWELQGPCGTLIVRGGVLDPGDAASHPWFALYQSGMISRIVFIGTVFTVNN